MLSTSLLPCRAAFAAVLLAGLAGAQMSGTYTIDPNGSGNRNFKDFPNAAYQVFVQGVSGPVLFDVAPGTYAQAFSLGPVKGVSSKNTITFKSRTKHGARMTATVTIPDFSANSPVSWYVFDGFEFAVSGTLPRAIIASGSATDFEIRNCKLTTSIIWTSGFSGARIRRWKIHHNVFNGTGRSTNTALSLFASQGMEIHHNEFNMNGIGGRAISISGTGSTFLRSRIYNNIIYGVQFSGSFALVTGITVGRHVDVFHNTIAVARFDSRNTPIAGSRGLIATGTFGRNVNVGNNIIINLASARRRRMTHRQLRAVTRCGPGSWHRSGS